MLSNNPLTALLKLWIFLNNENYSVFLPTNRAVFLGKRLVSSYHETYLGQLIHQASKATKMSAPPISLSLNFANTVTKTLKPKKKFGLFVYQFFSNLKFTNQENNRARWYQSEWSEGTIEVYDYHRALLWLEKKDVKVTELINWLQFHFRGRRIEFENS